MVYSEADLRAGVPDVDMRLAVARAEWFVSEYFSTGEVGGGVLPEGTVARTVPEGSYSWVEWARGIAVEATGRGRYDVTVVFRTVAGDGERPVAVTPVRAVQVPVVVDENGASGVADLPSPVPVPDAATAEALPVADGDVPESVASAALEIGRGARGNRSRRRRDAGRHRLAGRCRGHRPFGSDLSCRRLRLRLTARLADGSPATQAINCPAV